MPPGADEDSVERVARGRYEAGRLLPADDAVVREEPLEIQIGLTPVAVVMRTPGDDEELATGFLVTERVVRSAQEIASVRHCSVAASAEAAGNVIRALLVPGVELDLERLRRNIYASASCGICGKATIESALAAAPPLDDPLRLPAQLFMELPERLRRSQEVFSATGGLHAAGLFSADGALLVLREDIGRHNAVDKVVGWAARNGHLPLAGHLLLVSGRISYEIVQKALAARIPIVAAISAPSSLAVELASDADMALVAFLRDRSFGVYGARWRVVE